MMRGARMAAPLTTPARAVSAVLVPAAARAMPSLVHARAASSIRSARTSAPLMFESFAMPVSRTSIDVARVSGSGPVAFDDGLLDQMSANEIKGILSERLESADRSELLNMLQNSRLPQSETERVGVFESVSPSVAFISTTMTQQTWTGGTSEVPAGAGSGFVWDEDGHIVTNYHVVNGGPSGRPGRGGVLPRKVMVKLQGQDAAVEAIVVGHEADKDLAVLKVDPAALSVPLRPVEVASSSSLKVGQSVLAIGAPFGLDWTLTSGIVSALGRDIDGAGGRPIRDCVQTDAAINPGNSGGPLLDSRGKLIGINTMIYAPGGLGANVGIGFAVPSDTVRRFVNQIITHGPNARPSLGVAVVPDQIRSQYSRHLRRELEGAIIAEVVPGSPADRLNLAPCGPGPRGGILLGDMITAVNGNPVKKNEDLLCLVEESEPDEPLSLTVLRSCDPNRVEEVMITPVRRKALMEAQ